MSASTPATVECDCCAREVTVTALVSRIVDGQRLAVCDHCEERIDLDEEHAASLASFDREHFGAPISDPFNALIGAWS